MDSLIQAAIAADRQGTGDLVENSEGGDRGEE
jgi:hypothetical protein